MKPLWNLIIPFFYGDDKKYARVTGLGLLLVPPCSTIVGYQFIQWNLRFYDALVQKNYSIFIDECFCFCVITAAYVLLHSYAKFFGQKFALRWRQWMSFRAMEKWLKNPSRNQIESPDQRLQEDFKLFTNKIEKIFIEGLNAICSIVVYTPLVFFLSTKLTFFGYNIPGLLWLIALGYSILGMLLSYKIANPMISLEYKQQHYEAEFRYRLVHARDGSNYSNSFFQSLFKPIAQNYHKLFEREKYFNLWQTSYNRLGFFLPFILIAPGYFEGLFTLGVIMQIKAVFGRIRHAMSYLLEHYIDITQIQAISKRLNEFHDVLGLNNDVSKSQAPTKQAVKTKMYPL